MGVIKLADFLNAPSEASARKANEAYAYQIAVQDSAYANGCSVPAENLWARFPTGQNVTYEQIEDFIARRNATRT